MTIKFRCPHCQKALGVKDHLAGKKVACPACAKMLTIPAPAPAAPKPAAAPAAPDPNLEEVAAGLLAEQPAEEKPPEEPQFLTFDCPMCTETIRMPVELEGKQAPCPECRRIIKVPLREKKDPKDWRKVRTGVPSGAKMDEPAPEGTWDPATKTYVSRESLEQAGALPEEKERLTAWQWTKRGVLVAASLAVLSYAGYTAYDAYFTVTEKRLLQKAEDALKEPGKLKLSKEEVADAYRGIGEYYLSSHDRRSAKDANLNFQKARNVLLNASGTGNDRDLVLADLALLQVDLGGPRDEADAGQRLPWDKAVDNVRQTLAGIPPSSPARVPAVRAVVRKLLERGQKDLAAGLGIEVLGSTDPETYGVVGLELVRAGATAEADKLADKALDLVAPSKDAKGKTSVRPVPIEVVALCEAVAKKNWMQKTPQHRAGTNDDVLGRIEALAVTGDLEKARGKDYLERLALAPQAQLQAYLYLIDSPKAAPQDLEAVVKKVQEDWKNRQLAPLSLYQLVRLGVQAKQADKLTPVAQAIPDPAIRGRAQLELLKAKLAAATGKVDEGLVEEVESKSSAASAARGWIARHNAQFDSSGTARAVSLWDERLQPIGRVGTALGMSGATP